MCSRPSKHLAVGEIGPWFLGLTVADLAVSWAGALSFYVTRLRRKDSQRQIEDAVYNERWTAYEVANEYLAKRLAESGETVELPSPILW